MSESGTIAATEQERSLPRERDVGFVIVMSLVTLGFYSLYWLFRSFKEVRLYRGKGAGGIAGTLLSIILIGCFLLPDYVGRMYSENGQRRAISILSGYWIFLGLVGGFIWMARVQQALNEFTARTEAGVTSQEELVTTRQREEYGEQECPHCGAFSAADATHCRKCRQPLPQVS
jgi:ribosomal protein L40E